MKRLKKLFVLMGCILLCGGCSSSSDSQPTKSEELFKDLDAIATYEKASEYFNENVHYYKHVAKQTNISTNQISFQENSELFNEDGKHSYISFTKYEDFYNVTIVKDEKYFGLFNEEDVLQENILNQDTEMQKMFYDSAQNDFMRPVSQQEGVKIIDSSREDKEGDIIVHIAYSLTNEDEETTFYQTVDTYINQEGYIYKELIQAYDDAEMKTLTYSTDVMMSDLNQKDSFDYESEVNKYKAYVGQSADEIAQFIQ